MPREDVALLFLRQATACELLDSPLYAALLRRAAEDIREGGPCATAVARYGEAALDDALPLRLLGAVHALALTGRAPALAAHYPSAGGAFDPGEPDAAWPAFREAVAREPEWITSWLSRPPQTNEVGRSNLLLTGLLHAVPAAQRPVRLFELGSSAGLNLRVEQFRYEGGGFAWGPPDSPVRLTGAWEGGAPGWLPEAAARHPALRIVERRGCDPDPIDPLGAEGALALRAYVWPDQEGRMRRLEGAIQVAAKVPATVEAAGADEFLGAVELEPGTVTVVWHSVMRQYVPAARWAAAEAELARLAAAATPEAGFAHIAFEPRAVRGKPGFWLSVRSGREPERLLALAHPHGVPARWPGDGG
ncbi:DUF2332 domain-containing protein [Streptomyces sp. DSM 44917]|uniref:DUF2332 domain-containing protein n=1 Tax=Streptomyces boetiae TaxID=3075541 RepID=A0ABU2LE88_9ACTN|nr:DUF2332 domain-containing protein [Streptomyces sp. DSM 44917]MDT0309910.1 DUF2332 domain-containing protein [Streptomyces sp. DSM 44917]